VGCAPLSNTSIITTKQIISGDEENKMISKQFNQIHSAIKRKNKNNKNNSSIVNCYLKWDDYTEEKSYLEKMHNEIIKMPVEESLKSLHKFGYLGYLREEIYDGESYVIKHLFSEAWSDENYNDSKREGYCNVSSDVIKARIPKAIKIIMQREELEDNKNKNKTTTRIGQQRQQKNKKNKTIDKQ